MSAEQPNEQDRDPETDEAEGPSESTLIAERRAKADRLREGGRDPFPHSYPDRTEIAEVRGAHEDLEDGAETEQSYRVAGRITGVTPALPTPYPLRSRRRGAHTRCPQP